jgi:hypothetical protein
MSTSMMIMMMSMRRMMVMMMRTIIRTTVRAIVIAMVHIVIIWPHSWAIHVWWWVTHTRGTIRIVHVIVIIVRV